MKNRSRWMKFDDCLELIIPFDDDRRKAWDRLMYAANQLPAKPLPKSPIKARIMRHTLHLDGFDFFRWAGAKRKYADKKPQGMTWVELRVKMLGPEHHDCSISEGMEVGSDHFVLTLPSDPKELQKMLIILHAAYEELEKKLSECERERDRNKEDADKLRNLNKKKGRRSPQW